MTTPRWTGRQVRRVLLVVRDAPTV